MSRRSAILLAIFLLFPPTAASESHRLRFDPVFDIGEVANQSFIQDRDGFIWVGSKGGGLYRYNGYEVENYPPGERGLSGGSIYAILEDSADPDTLWVGTMGGGLNRYDRITNTFTAHKHDPADPSSLSSNAINSVVQDRRPPYPLWIATAHGLNRFDRETGRCRHYFHDPADPKSLGEDDIWRVVQDPADPDVFWLALWGSGLNRLDTHTGKVTRYIHDPANPDSLGTYDNIICGIGKDADDPNILWLGTIQDGLVRFDKTTEAFRHFRHRPDDPESFPGGTVALIYDDGTGRLFLGGWVEDNGLTVFDKASGTFTNYRHHPADSHGIRHDNILNVRRDRTGIYWVVSTSGKVDKIDPYAPAFAHHAAGDGNPAHFLSDPVVNTILEDRDGDVWIGTTGGLDRYDPGTRTYAHFRHQPDDPTSIDFNNVVDLFEDADGDFWVSVLPGPLMRFDRDSGKVVERIQPPPESDAFLEVVQDPSAPEIYWLGVHGSGGLARLDRRTQELTTYPRRPEAPETGVNAPDIYRVVHDRTAPTLWLGSIFGGGLTRFDKRTGRFTHFVHDPKDPRSIASDAVVAIHPDDEGILWAGTKGGGLNRLDPEKETFDRFSTDHGIPADVNSILADPAGRLWLGTNAGILAFDPKTETVVVRFDRRDGLQGNAFSIGCAARTADGRLWFGGTNGANSFYPGRLRQNPHPPPVVLTAITQANHPIPTDRTPERTRRLTLPWNQNFFEFEYAALNYTQPERNRYAYYLEGLEGSWFDAGTRRFGRYTALDPGHYILHIKAANNDGVWNEAGIEIDVTVAAPWWRKWWFHTSWAAAVIGVMAALLHAKLRWIQSERRRMASIRESEDRLRRVVDNMPVMMTAVDKAGTIVFWNRECERITGYSADAVVGRHGSMAWLHPEPVSGDGMAAPDGGPPPDFRDREWSLTCEDGSQRTILVSNVSRTAPIPGWFAWSVGVDVTDQKKAEAERERLEGRLRQAMKMEAVGRLAAGISHDFNNMLTPILGYAQMLQDAFPDGDDRRSQLEAIQQAALRSRRLVRRLLAFSRKQVLTVSRVDLPRLIHQLEDMLRRTIREDITIRLSLDPETAPVLGDLTQIEQILMNLVVNAADAMPAGGTLTIETATKTVDAIPEAAEQSVMRPGRYALLSVTDTGQGMDQATLEQVFEPFFSTKGAGEGTGLGLATVYGITKQHGGYVWVYSEPGRGTTFKVYFPAATGGETMPPPEADVPAAAKSPRSGTILVVEDDDMVRRMTVEMLRRAGHHAISANSPAKAIETFATMPERVDLLLTDVVMPGMNGRALYERLRMDQPGLKALFMSGYTDNVIADQGILEPGTHLIEKPFSMDGLLAKVADLMSG